MDTIIRSAINKTLPYELQEVIWKRYFVSFVCTELNLLRNEMCEYERIYENCCEFVNDLIQVALVIFNRSSLEFNITLEFLEDRLFEDIWNSDGIGILFTLRTYIISPNMLKIELLNYCQDDNEYKRIPSRLEYKIAHECRLNEIQRKINNISNIYYMLKGREEDTDDDEYLNY